MNRTNRHERHPLDLCPVCGMDSGERVQSTDAPFKQLCTVHHLRCHHGWLCPAVQRHESVAERGCVEMKIYPVCAKCSIVMNPNAFDDVAPGFLINGECYCPECAKDWLKDEVDSDPEAVARAMGIAIIDIPED